MSTKASLGAPILDIRTLSKEFAGNRALDTVSLEIAAGTIHMLVGQNGSGKSTLIKVLAGYHTPEAGGEVTVSGQALQFGHPEQAYHLGCRFVHQDLALIEDLNVTENLFLGARYPMQWGVIRNRQAFRSGQEMIDRIGLDVDLRAPVSTLNASQRTGVAIARALRLDEKYPERVLVLDEPTATLPADEVSALLDTVRVVAAQGVAVLFVTHHIDEIFRLGDEVTILRDGVAVHTGPIAELTRDGLVAHLTGEEKQRQVVKLAADAGAELRLSIKHLVAPGVRDVCIEVAEGEILGIAGITGSGREAILGAVFGAGPRISGQVEIDGRPVPPSRPDLAIGLGIGFMPPDRKVSGSFPTLNAQDNVTVLNMKKFWHRWFLSPKEEKEEAKTWFRRLDVRPIDGTGQRFDSFSGGNQQKILFGKWLSKSPLAFLLDEPTQGVDIGAKGELHRQLMAFAEAGTSIVISSTDIEELVAICSRVIVMSDGHIDREIVGSDITVANLTRSFVSVDDG
ncbi:MAG TPA: sugar ABC transporter ATP-binding protein [Acidimicrobiales bacterium]